MTDLPVKKHDELLKARIAQMRENREAVLFQHFCIMLLIALDYKEVAESNPHTGDLGCDGIAFTHDGKRCFAGVSERVVP